MRESQWARAFFARACMQVQGRKLSISTHQNPRVLTAQTRKMAARPYLGAVLVLGIVVAFITISAAALHAGPTPALAVKTGCSSISPGGFNSNCVADATSPFVRGAGTIIATVGIGGVGINSQNGSDPEAGYFATFQGSNANPTFGFLKVTVSSTSLSVQFVRGAGGSFTDSFTIQ